MKVYSDRARRFEFDSQPFSAQVEMLERLLQIDLEQAIVWNLWDQSRHSLEDSPVSYFVGSAGHRGWAILDRLCDVGTSWWGVHYGDFVNPTGVENCRPNGAADGVSGIDKTAVRRS